MHTADGGLTLRALVGQDAQWVHTADGGLTLRALVGQDAQWVHTGDGAGPCEQQWPGRTHTSPEARAAARAR